MFYLIVTNNDRKEFEKEVNQKIKEGFTLQGGVSVACGDRYLYCQAMIRER